MYLLRYVLDALDRDRYEKLFCHVHVPEMMLFLYVLYNTLFKHVNNKRTIYQASFFYDNVLRET